MAWWQKIKHSTLYIQWTNWEYLPMYVTNLPVIFIWWWFALRARQMFFFSAVNPSIETGGVLGESKVDILQKIPKTYLPKTVFFKKGSSLESVCTKLETAQLNFPMLAKPNVGERGFLVSRIENASALQAYVRDHKIDFLVQEFVQDPVELSVLHHVFPEKEKGRTTSICLKKFLSIEGNGKDSVATLMQAYPRAKLQYARLYKETPEVLESIPEKGATLLLEPIGNHCRGTTFLNGNHWIDDRLSAVFDHIMGQMEGIHYGRFDLKCSDIESLRKGKLTILEFNGIAGEPAHIYDPAYPVWKKYRDIYRHWEIIFQIYQEQRKRGIHAMGWAEALRSVKNYFSYKKNATN